MEWISSNELEMQVWKLKMMAILGWLLRVGLLGQSCRVGFYCILQQFGNQKFWVVGENG